MIHVHNIHKEFTLHLSISFYIIDTQSPFTFTSLRGLTKECRGPHFTTSSALLRTSSKVGWLWPRYPSSPEAREGEEKGGEGEEKGGQD